MKMTNIIIKNEFLQDSDQKMLFDDEPVVFSNANTIEELLVELGCFTSKSQARKAGREGPVPGGFTQFKATKKKWLWIWNPTE